MPVASTLTIGFNSNRLLKGKHNELSAKRNDVVDLLRLFIGIMFFHVN